MKKTEVKTTQDVMQKLIRVRSYLNKERFIDTCGSYCKDYRKEFESMNMNFFYWISQTDERIVSELIRLDERIQDENLLKTVDIEKRESLKKVIIQGGHEIVDMSTLEGLRKMVAIHECHDQIKILRHSDTIESKGIKMTLFEGDVIKCYDNWKNNVKMILSVFDDTYQNPNPYYLELLYTEKYGYLNASDRANKDEEKLKFDCSIFNTDGNYNYNVITLTAKFEVVCNIFQDISILRPLKSKS